MIEEGIVKLVQSDPVVAALCPIGGFMAQLPDGQPLPCWTYLVFSNNSHYCLDGTHGLTKLRLQIDCYGDPDRARDVIRLGRAIDNVLSGYRGTLPDVDSTIVHGCFQSNLTDFFNDVARNYRRMLEYEIDFSDTVLGE